MCSKNLFRHCLHFSSSYKKSNKAATTIYSLTRRRYNRCISNLTTASSTVIFATQLRQYHPKLVKVALVFDGKVIAKRTAVTAAAMAQPINGTPVSGNVLEGAAAVIRYQPGEERFQMQVTINTGKMFNFERRCEDSVASVVARMVTNMTKKLKNFDGTVKFLGEDHNEVLIDKETTPMESLLKLALCSPNGLKLQVAEQVYGVVMNPPEFYLAKFFPVYMPTFPLFPYKMETSSNFDKMASHYKWEFSKEKPLPCTPPKLRKKSIDEGSQGSKTPTTSWTECGSTMTFIPDQGMEGGYLRFTCIPSNGTTFGKPFTTTLPNPVTPLQVETFLYEERLSRLSPKREDGDCLRVLTYNVLADTYATPEWFISSPKESLDAGYRLPILNKEINSYKADIICLQEVDEKYFEGNFEPFLAQHGYKGRHTSKTGNTREGIAIFHNPAKFTELEYHRNVILEEMKRLPLWERLKTVSGNFIERMEERNTVFQMSILQANDCAKKTILVLGNVHLYFHPDADHIRLLQTITCINILERTVASVKQEYPNHRVTVMFCGDFNCTPPFSSFRLLTTGQVDENDEDWTSHPDDKIAPGLNIKHSLNLTNSHPGEELTNITTCFEGCLDYILYQEEHIELLCSYPPPSKEEIAVLTKIDDVRKVSLPNFYTPSDHLPLIVDLKFKT